MTPEFLEREHDLARILADKQENRAPDSEVKAKHYYSSSSSRRRGGGVWQRRLPEAIFTEEIQQCGPATFPKFRRLKSGHMRSSREIMASRHKHYDK